MGVHLTISESVLEVVFGLEQPHQVEVQSHVEHDAEDVEASDGEHDGQVVVGESVTDGQEDGAANLEQKENREPNLKGSLEVDFLLSVALASELLGYEEVIMLLVGFLFDVVVVNLVDPTIGLGLDNVDHGDVLVELQLDHLVAAVKHGLHEDLVDVAVHRVVGREVVPQQHEDHAEELDYHAQGQVDLEGGQEVGAEGAVRIMVQRVL